MRTFDIPGGKATFRERDERTSGGSRMVAMATRRMRRVIAITDEAAKTEEAGEKVELDALGFPTTMSDDDVDASWAFNDALILADLKGWTLDDPLPKNRADLDELSLPIYQALNQAVAELMRDARAAAKQDPDGDDPLVDDFSVDAVENPDSPTGA